VPGFDLDVSYEEIGRILGCSIPAVKVRIHRARVALTAGISLLESNQFAV